MTRAAALIATVAALVAAAPAAAAVPLPDKDPFYAVPADIGGLANGAILRSRPIQATALSVPLPVKSWQVLYKTLDTHDRPTATVATIMVPQLPWLDRGPRPLLSYQTAEDGVSTKCSPSYGIRAGLSAGLTNSSAETLAMTPFLVRGIAVVAPDYEGPRSEFTGVGMAAHGVLDGMRAALAFKPAKLSPQAPLGMLGYSGGALASSLAAQLQSGYAPELKLAGIALGGVVADLRATLKAFSGSAVGGALAMGLAGADRTYPEHHVRSYLNAAGNRALDQAQDDCINDAVARHPFAKIEDWQARPGLIDDPTIVKLMREISPLGVPGTPTAPVLGYHTILDELAPIGPARILYERYCAAGVRVTRVEDPIGEHISGVATGAARAFLWLSDRFAGRRAPSSC